MAKSILGVSWKDWNGMSKV